MNKNEIIGSRKGGMTAFGYGKPENFTGYTPKYNYGIF